MAEDGLNTPKDFVQSGWDQQRDWAGGYITMSKEAITDLTSLQIVPIQFDAQFDLTIDYGTFVRPVAPEVPELGTIDVTLPTVPTVTPVSIRDLGDAPSEPDFSNLTYLPPAAPTAQMPEAPTDITPALEAITIPDAPEFTLPDLPTLYDLNLPDAPLITLPEFAGVRPTIDMTGYLPDRALNWQEVAYSSTLLDTIKVHLADMITGGLGLPADVEAAIFDRGRSRADMLADKRVAEAAEELGHRGLIEPAGYLAARLDRARVDGRAEAAGLNRDITIRSADVQIESIRFALTQAGALESTLMQLNGQINQRALDAAKVASDIQVAVFNALITRYNLDVEVFKAEASVFRDLIQAEIAKAEVYRAQIEGQKAIGDVNESLIRAYAEQVKSVQALADIYRAQVEAARARGEINTQRLEQARLKIQTFGIQVDAFGKQQDAYKTATEAALGNVRVFEAIGNVYGRRVEAYKVKGEAYIQEGQFQISQQQLGFDGFKAALEGSRTLIAAQTASIDATARTFAARAGMYQAEGAVVAAEAASNDRTASLRIEAARARLEAILKSTDARINQNIQISGLYIEQLKSKAQVISQLAAATLSGVNFGASFNGSMSVGTNYGVGFNYSGDTDDLNPAYFPYVNF